MADLDRQAFALAHAALGDTAAAEDETARLIVLNNPAATISEFRERLEKAHPRISFARRLELVRKYRGLGPHPPTHDAATGQPR